MKNTFNEKTYIEYKLLGLLDDKTLLSKKENIDKNKITPTIFRFLQKRYNLSQSNFELWKNKYDKEIQFVKKSFRNHERQEYFTLESFYQWYIKQPRSCCYCGVKEGELSQYFNEETKQYKKARQRGKVLEIERVLTSNKKENIYSEKNSRLSCYICNNAKSDFLHVNDFKPIAKGINKFWENTLKRKVEFPTEVYSTFKNN